MSCFAQDSLGLCLMSQSMVHLIKTTFWLMAVKYLEEGPVFLICTEVFVGAAVHLVTEVGWFLFLSLFVCNFQIF